MTILWCLGHRMIVTKYYVTDLTAGVTVCAYSEQLWMLTDDNLIYIDRRHHGGRVKEVLKNWDGMEEI